jgi:hypothetical protein
MDAKAEPSKRLAKPARVIIDAALEVHRHFALIREKT